MQTSKRYPKETQIRPNQFRCHKCWTHVGFTNQPPALAYEGEFYCPKHYEYCLKDVD